MTQVGPPREDAGFATLAGLGIGLFVVAVGALVMTLVGVAGLRHRAEAAADLGALAGASHALEGEQVACSYVRRVVAAHRVVLERCALEGLDTVVSVRVAPAGRLRALGSVRAAARAGAR